MKRWLLTLLVLLLCAGCALGEENPFVYGPPQDDAEIGLEVRFLDVVGADAIYLRCGGESMLVDGGLRTDGVRIGKYFASLGITGVTYMVNTHSHPDHIGGLTQLLRTGFNAGLALCPYSENKKEDNFIAFLRMLKKRSIPYARVDTGDTMKLGDADITFFRCIDEGALKNRNDNSLVMRVQYGERSVILTADIGGRAQRLLALEYGAALKADVAKSAHHGVALFVPEWMEAAKPSFMVCTNGANRVPLLIQQAAENDIPLLFTKPGVIWMRTDGAVWRVWQTGNMTKANEDELIYPTAESASE